MTVIFILTGKLIDKNDSKVLPIIDTLEEKMKDIKDTVIDCFGCSVDIYLDSEIGLKRVYFPNDGVTRFTLDEIYQSFKDQSKMIYVFCDSGLRGAIYRCGNYDEGIWQKYADAQGYA